MGVRLADDTTLRDIEEADGDYRAKTGDDLVLGNVLLTMGIALHEPRVRS